MGNLRIYENVGELIKVVKFRRKYQGWNRDKEKLRLQDVKVLHPLSTRSGGMIDVTLSHTYLITWQGISLMEMNMECLYDSRT